MPRPKLPNGVAKEKLNLTVSKETKEMLEIIRIKKNISLRNVFEKSVKK